MDGFGFLAGLLGEHGPDAIKGKRCLLLGAGGAARAIALALLEEGASAVAVVNRTRARAEALAAAVPGVRVLDALPEAPLSRDFDVAVQCTNQGHEAADADPCPLEVLRPPLLCAEVIHTPAETRWLAAARAAGCATHRGKFMLDAQIASIAEFLALDPADWPPTWAYAPK